MNWTVDVPIDQLPDLPPLPDDAHDALVDAQHNLRRYQLMTGAD